MIRKIIKNRKNQKIVVIVEKSELQKDLAFVMHGLGGFKEQPHIQVMAEAFRENGYTVVRFDTTNTLGESDGNYEDATITNYYEDLEDVIKWSESQEWYEEPFILAGHSLGGISVALFAENFPEKVKALAPISTVVSGELSIEAYRRYKPDKFKEWERTGWKVEKSHSKLGTEKRLKWSHMLDRLKYNLLLRADKLTMPVLLIVGSEDKSTPPEHQKILYEALPEPKELHIIKDAPHTFRAPGHLFEMRQIFNKWIARL